MANKYLLRCTVRTISLRLAHATWCSLRTGANVYVAGRADQRSTAADSPANVAARTRGSFANLGGNVATGLQEQQLQFPPLVQPLGSPTDANGLPLPKLYDSNGQPILDSEQRPIYLTEELRQALAELETQSPEDWLADGKAFFSAGYKT